MEEFLSLHPDVLGTILAKHRSVQEVVEVVNKASANTFEEVKINVNGNGRIRLNSSGCEENGDDSETIDINISGNYRPFVLYIHTDNGGHTIGTEGDIGVELEKPHESTQKECFDKTSKTHRRNQSAGFVFVQGVAQYSCTATDPVGISTSNDNGTPALNCSDLESAIQATGGTPCHIGKLNGSSTSTVVGDSASGTETKPGLSTNGFDEVDSRLNDMNCNPTHECKRQRSSEVDSDNTACKFSEPVDTGKALTHKNIHFEEHVDGCAFGDQKRATNNAHLCTCKKDTHVLNDNNNANVTDTHQYVKDISKTHPDRRGTVVGDTHADSCTKSDQCFPVTTRCDVGIRQSFVQLLDRIYLMELCDHMYQNYVIDVELYQLMFDMSISSKERDAKRHLLLYLSKRSVDRDQMLKSLNGSAQYQLIPCFYPDVNKVHASIY